MKKTAILPVPVLDQSLIQGIVFTGYPHLEFASYLVLAIDDGARLRGWLGTLVPLVTDGRRGERSFAINVAFTEAGLRALGLPADAVATFPREFSEGMAGSAARSRILGDLGSSDPSGWQWGGHAPGPTGAPVHALLMLYAPDSATLERLHEQMRAGFAGAAHEIFVRDTVVLPGKTEHFGFVDGLSQPRIAGSDATDGPSHTTVKAGEFLLGHANEYDTMPVSPTVADGAVARTHLPVAPASDRRDLGANGSYLVVRQLAQDVAGFWSAMYRESGAEDGAPSEAKAVYLAAKCLGRWPSGAPLSLAPHHDNPDLHGENAFGYRDDPGGLKCPVGAHIRRANPRDSLPPGPAESARLVRRHMILRRGRAYGPPLARWSRDGSGEERGLVFIAVNSNISRQFEFIQQSWLHNPKFDGLYDERDPISAGNVDPRGGTFSIPEAPARRRMTGLPSFVTTRGGAYFFLPGLAALKYLAAL